MKISYMVVSCVMVLGSVSCGSAEDEKSGGYMSLNGSYLCKAQGPDEGTVDKVVYFEAEARSAILTSGSSVILERSDRDSNGFPLYTNARALGDRTTVVSFKEDKTMQWAEGTLTELNSLRMIATYVGLCTKQ